MTIHTESKIATNIAIGGAKSQFASGVFIVASKCQVSFMNTKVDFQIVTQIKNSYTIHTPGTAAQPQI